MTVGDRALKRMKEIGMNQKEFSAKTGIAQSTISEWKSKRNNPTAEKIMTICSVLDVTPEWLLSGATARGKRSNKPDFYVIDKESDMGYIIESVSSMDQSQLDRLLGYMAALSETEK